MKIINKIENFFLILFLFIPVFLITGPAIPDIIISFIGIYFIIIYIIFKKNFFLFKENIVLSSFLFWISLIIISFFSFNKSVSFQDSFIFIRFLLIPIIGYYFFLKNEKYLNITIGVIFFTVCFVMLDSLYQFLNYDPQEGFKEDLLGFKSNWYGRLTGPFKDELVPGSFVAKFGFIGLVFLLIINKTKFNQFISVLYLSLIGVICFASGERMALAQYCLGLFILIIFLKNYRFILLSSLLTFLILNFFIYKNHPIYSDYKVIESTHYHQGLKIEKNFNCPNDKNKICSKIINIQPSFIEILNNFSTSAYGEIYNSSLKMFINNPITGIGINNYKYVCEKDKTYNNLIKNFGCASHPHNFYLQWLAEGGLIVFIAFIIYLYSLFITIIKNCQNHSIKIITITNLIILFWPIMSTGSLLKNWNGVLTFFIITICIAMNIIKTNTLK